MGLTSYAAIALSAASGDYDVTSERKTMNARYFFKAIQSKIQHERTFTLTLERILIMFLALALMFTAGVKMG